LAIASSLTEEFGDVYVFEKNNSFGKETSSRNSEILHGALVYYPKNSLKAKLCASGINFIYGLNPEIVPYRKTGKLIVAKTDEEISKLESLLKRGLENGAESLRLIDQKEIKKLEPEMNALAAIYSPETGIVSSHKLMEYFLETTKHNSGLEPVIYRAEVIGIDKVKEGYKITFKQDNKEETFFARILVNSAGLHSERIAKMAGIDTVSAGYELEFWKGEYFSVNGKHKGKTSRLIYPLPGKVGLGIHTVLDLEGNLKLGPNAFHVDDIDYMVDESKKREFYESMKDILPFLQLDDLQPDMAGIRPKLKETDDFIIKEESETGFPGFINLTGIGSPGLTAAPAIGKFVKELIKKCSK
ncbi:MAG: NAD(P)/FAD-dependent oxidoreductase, partial [Candidatus Pacearchaeota archaeon]|nr:NAD(P)/FAD-dependent oxidoreductase [Candidatus Pacearchaeota archaeon]